MSDPQLDKETVVRCWVCCGHVLHRPTQITPCIRCHMKYHDIDQCTIVSVTPTIIVKLVAHTISHLHYAGALMICIDVYMSSTANIEVWEWKGNFIPHSLYWVYLLIHTGIKVNHVSKKGPDHDDPNVTVVPYRSHHIALDPHIALQPSSIICSRDVGSSVSLLMTVQHLASITLWAL